MTFTVYKAKLRLRNVKSEHPGSVRLKDENPGNTPSHPELLSIVFLYC